MTDYNWFEFQSTNIVLRALQALSSNSKQILRVTITSSGVQFRCEDDGKVCQSSVHFPASYFSSFNFSGSPTTFNVQLGALVDALRVFVNMPDMPVRVSEAANNLVLELSDSEEGVSLHMHAHVSILGTTHIINLMDHWQPPATEFTTNASLLREAIEDLEWPRGHVQVKVHAHPFQVSLSSRGNVGELEAVLPRNHVRNPRTHGRSISFFYAYKFAKSAMSGIQGIKAEYSSQLAIDDNGLLKVVHMLPGIRRAGGSGSQASQASSNDVILTFMVQPLCSDELRDEDRAREAEMEDTQ